MPLNNKIKPLFSLSKGSHLEDVEFTVIKFKAAPQNLFSEGKPILFRNFQFIDYNVK